MKLFDIFIFYFQKLQFKAWFSFVYRKSFRNLFKKHCSFIIWKKYSFFPNKNSWHLEKTNYFLLFWFYNFKNCGSKLKFSLDCIKFWQLQTSISLLFIKFQIWDILLNFDVFRSILTTTKVRICINELLENEMTDLVINWDIYVRSCQNFTDTMIVLIIEEKRQTSQVINWKQILTDTYFGNCQNFELNIKTISAFRFIF